MTIKNLSSENTPKPYLTAIIQTPVVILLLGCLAGAALVVYKNSLPVKAPVYGSSVVTSMTEMKEKQGNMSAWVPWWDEENTTASLRTAAPSLTRISPVWYRLLPNGQVIEIKAGNKATIKEIARENNLDIIPTVSNDDGNGFKPESVTKLLSSETRVESFTETLVTDAKVYGFDGWDIDFEEVKSSDRERYLLFMKRLSDALHAEDLILTTAVHAREGADKGFEGSLAHDYEELGQIVDEMRIMAYDFHNKTTEPGPITPLDQLDSVLAYAVESIPYEKIVVGLPLYGYEWTKGAATNMDYIQARKKITQHQGSLRRDMQSQELVGTYDVKGQEYTVWFQDRESIDVKMNVAQKYGLTHFVFWKIGGEDASLWK